MLEKLVEAPFDVCEYLPVIVIDSTSMLYSVVQLKDHINDHLKDHIIFPAFKCKSYKGFSFKWKWIV